MPYPAVVLNAGTMSLYYDAPSPPLDAWQSRTIPLAEQGWKISGVHTEPTQAQFQAVLANLQGLYIYTEWRTGSDDTNVDNIQVFGRCAAGADFDCDGDVDVADYIHFQACFNGPDAAYGQPGCSDADFDNDSDVDVADFVTFQACFNGPDRTPAC